MAGASNIWVADLSSTGITSVPGLRFADGPRLQRAQYPNFDREAKGMMPPGVFRAGWTPQQTPEAPRVQIDLPTSYINRNTSASMFQTWTGGIGGTCEGQFQPAAGYWCSKNVQGGGSVIYYVPMAMQASTATLPNSPYANPVGAVVQTWRPGHWASVSTCAPAARCQCRTRRKRRQRRQRQAAARARARVRACPASAHAGPASPFSRRPAPS